MWNSREFLIRWDLSKNKKELREWAMCMSVGGASAKALRQEQGWYVAKNSKEALVATVERTRRRMVDVFTEAAVESGLIEPCGYWKNEALQ